MPCPLSASLSKEKIVTLNSAGGFIHIWCSNVFWLCGGFVSIQWKKYHHHPFPLVFHGCWTSAVSLPIWMHDQLHIKLARYHSVLLDLRQPGYMDRYLKASYLGKKLFHHQLTLCTKLCFISSFLPLFHSFTSFSSPYAQPLPLLNP